MFFDQTVMKFYNYELLLYNLNLIPQQQPPCEKCQKDQLSNIITPYEASGYSIKCRSEQCAASIHLICQMKSEHFKMYKFKSDRQNYKIALYCPLHEPSEQMEKVTRIQLLYDVDQFLKSFMLKYLKHNKLEPKKADSGK